MIEIQLEGGDKIIIDEFELRGRSGKISLIARRPNLVSAAGNKATVKDLNYNVSEQVQSEILALAQNEVESDEVVSLMLSASNDPGMP